MSDEDEVAAMDDRELMETLAEIDEGLSDSDVDFVDSLAKQVLDRNKLLSTKQRPIAEKILLRYWEEHGR
jgi:hypothetical protein